MTTFDLTVTGDSSLSVRHFSAHEAISELFSVAIVARSKSAEIDIDAIVGRDASLRIEPDIPRKGEGIRTWKGIVSSMEQTAVDTTGLSTYQIHIVPQLWLLTQRTGHRIFQHKSIPDIIDMLLMEWKIKPVWKVIRANYPKLENRVQYGESDFAFFSRLLEEAGIAYTFPDEHGTGGVLTLDDDLHNGLQRPGDPLHFADNPNIKLEKSVITNVRFVQDVRPGASTSRDFDFRNPAFELTGKALPVMGAEAKYEHYRYEPGAFAAASIGGDTPIADKHGAYRYQEKRGMDLATRVLASMRADRRRIRFDTNLTDLYAGRVFKMENHPHPNLKEKFLLTSFSIDGGPAQEWQMVGQAVFADPRAPYKPPLKTPKPVCTGPQSAIVVGPLGKQIHVDEFGRVRVQFPWDRERGDDESSCWLRVSQGWAGRGYGMITIPRIGHEVLVAFLDGDPDQPLVVGRAFNAREVVPYRLPESDTVSTWKSNSLSPAGGYNEIKYDDEAERELFYVRAERDRHTLVKRDEVERVVRDRRVTIGQDPLLAAQGSAPSATPMTGGNDELVVRGERKTLVHKDEHVHVKQDRIEKIDGTVSLTIGQSRDEKVTMNHALEVGNTIHIKAGMHLVIEAGARLTIKSSGGFIDIHPEGIDIVGNVVNINSGGEAGEGSGANPKRPEDADEAHPKDKPIR